MLRLLFAAVGVVVVLGVAQFAPGVTATAHAHSTGGHTDRREPYTKWKLRELRLVVAVSRVLPPLSPPLLLLHLITPAWIRGLEFIGGNGNGEEETSGNEAAFSN